MLEIMDIFNNNSLQNLSLRRIIYMSFLFLLSAAVSSSSSELKKERNMPQEKKIDLELDWKFEQQRSSFQPLFINRRVKGKLKGISTETSDVLSVQGQFPEAHRTPHSYSRTLRLRGPGQGTKNNNYHSRNFRKREAEAHHGDPFPPQHFFLSTPDTGAPKWTKKFITYRISEYSSQGMSRKRVESEIAKAFQIWEQYVDLIFIKSTDHDVDIEIKFVVGEHGDYAPFTGGLAETLGHAYPPVFDGMGLAGDVHFNDNFTWTEGNTLLHTAAHELGHALGLNHSNSRTAIMSPYQGDGVSEVRLDFDDILKVQALYGIKHKKGKTKPPVILEPRGSTTTTTRPKTTATHVPTKIPTTTTKPPPTTTTKPPPTTTTRPSTATATTAAPSKTLYVNVTQMEVDHESGFTPLPPTTKTDEIESDEDVHPHSFPPNSDDDGYESSSSEEYEDSSSGDDDIPFKPHFDEDPNWADENPSNPTMDDFEFHENETHLTNSSRDLRTTISCSLIPVATTLLLILNRDPFNLIRYPFA